MFHSRLLNNKINRIHERALIISYKDYLSNFNVLLENDSLVSIHVNSPQTLMIETFNTKENLNPTLNEVDACKRSIVYKLRSNGEFCPPG